jgi:hypothetical protein
MLVRAAVSAAALQSAAIFRGTLAGESRPRQVGEPALQGQVPAGLSVLTRFSAGEQQLGELEQFAKNSSTRSIKDQIEMHFALGKAYDDAGRYANAFQ